MIKVHAHAIAAAAPFQAVKDVRYYLNGIYFEPVKGGGCRVVATNGHCAIEVIDWEGECEKPVILAIDPQGITKMRHVRAGDVWIDPLADTPDRVMVHLWTPEHFCTGGVIDGKFPDLDRVMPAELPPATADFVNLNSKYVALFATVARLLNPTYQGFCLHTLDRAHAIAITFHPTIRRLFARGLVMPLKESEEDRQVQWKPKRPGK